MPKYMITSGSGGVTFYDSYERFFDGVRVVARREENNDFAEVIVVFPNARKIPDEDEDLMLEEYEHSIETIDGDMQAWWYIESDISEDMEDELLEELFEDDNGDEKWIFIEGSHAEFLPGGYVMMKKLRD